MRPVSFNFCKYRFTVLRPIESLSESSPIVIAGLAEMCSSNIFSGSLSGPSGSLSGPSGPPFKLPTDPKWRYEDLPIIPKTWEYGVAKDKAAQFNIIKKLMASKEVDHRCLRYRCRARG
jgi:hypothetical protein